MRISQSAFDLIVAEEVSSRAYYERHYTRPEWPGGASGITVGIGYDLGYAKPDKIRADWGNLVAPEILAVMVECSGVTGSSAQAMLPRVKGGIVIGWNAAIDVFTNRDVPSWTAAVIRCIPAANALNDTCLGTLVSIAYNRGASFSLSGDRYVEMRSIRDHVALGKLDAVAGDILSMKRLWPSVKGLRDRRDHEAALWKKGLSEAGSPAGSPAKDVPVAPDASVPLKPGPARTKPPVTTPAQSSTAVVVAAGGAALAQQAHAHGMLSPELAVFAGFLAVLAGVTAWVIWHRNRNPK